MNEQKIKINEFIEKYCENEIRRNAIPMIARKFKIEYEDALKEYNRWRKRYMMAN